jgi:hypothetical protein
MLTIIASALVAIACQGLLNPTTTAHAASASTAQAYEYKTVIRYNSINSESGYVGGTKSWKEDAADPPSGYSNDDSGLGVRIRDLENQGWEMIANVPFSNLMNVNDAKTRSLNGVTTSERFIFKRKK